MEIISMTIEVPATVKQDEKWFVASSVQLDMHGQGETSELAISALQEALEVFFESCLSRGVLEKVLSDCGFKRVVSRQMDVQNRPSVKVNLPIAAIDNGLLCRA